MAEKILLVEDDPQLQGFLKRTLEGAGYVVLIAADGERGLQLFQAYEDQLELVITDVILPKLNGIDLAQLIEARAPEAKILLISGQIDSSSLMDYRRETTRLLLKPLNLDTFLQTVHELIAMENESPADEL